MIEGEDVIWMTTIQMLVKIAGDGKVVLDTTEKAWTGAKSKPQFDEWTGGRLQLLSVKTYQGVTIDLRASDGRDRQLSGSGD